MKQYFDIKAKHPDAILLFRVGDFYEMYGEDAVIDLIGKCMSSNWQGIIWDRLKKAEAESGSWHYDPGSMEGSL